MELHYSDYHCGTDQGRRVVRSAARITPEHARTHVWVCREAIEGVGTLWGTDRLVFPYRTEAAALAAAMAMVPVTALVPIGHYAVVGGLTDERTVVGCQAADAGSAQPDNQQPTTDNARLAPPQPDNRQQTTDNPQLGIEEPQPAHTANAPALERASAS